MVPEALGGTYGGQGWIRTSVRLHGQIYSLLPLTTRPPVHWGRHLGERRPLPMRPACVNA
ncbi:hypothetical protein SPHINGOAX6_30247 [Sphingomonas sp. AX6]|nr:hypothetical protein SPHINGOAX6_30247 [Sphingomonas sp. AX6]